MREALPSDALETRVAGAGDPVAEALRRADLAALWQAIDALPPVQRNALLLREFGGLSYEELAAALSVSEPAVESLLFRARRRLRVQLRAAAAALTGASWLEALARLVVGGGAPVAAKVAALGIGAAALGSGAAVVPQVFDNHHSSRPSQQQVHTHAKPARLASTKPRPPTFSPVPAQPAVRIERRREDRHRARSGPLPVERRSGSDRSGRGGGPDDDSTVTTVTTVTTTPTATVEEGRGGGDGPDGGGSEGGGSGGSDGGAGDDGH
jgi:DNA-binding CsgD family transcriptional regulator